MDKNVLPLECIFLHQKPKSKEEIIRDCGQNLLERGCVTPKYIEGMLKRDEECSCAIGCLLAIPHGEAEYRDEVLRSGLVVFAYDEAFDWGGEKVRLVVGIAGKGEEHIDILANLAELADCDESIEKFLALNDANKMRDILCATMT